LTKTLFHPQAIKNSAKPFRIAFELELHEKGKKKYEKITSRYQSNDQYDYIIYVCGSTTISTDFH